jgi:vacuolar-type H+-ATPase subunit E/Vma4
MSLEAILAAIRETGQAQIDEFLLEAQTEADAILEEARSEAQRVRESAARRTALPAYRERARILHRGRLEALQTLGETREVIIAEALTLARQQLSQMRSDSRYPHILRELTEQAIEDLRDSLEDVHTVRVVVDPRDEALMVQILDSLGLDLPVTGQLQCWGGLVASSEDGRIVAINTLESRLERAMPYLRRQLAALFEEEGGVPRPDSITETPVSGQ